MCSLANSWIFERVPFKKLASYLFLVVPLPIASLSTPVSKHPIPQCVFQFKTLLVQSSAQFQRWLHRQTVQSRLKERLNFKFSAVEWKVAASLRFAAFCHWAIVFASHKNPNLSSFNQISNECNKLALAPYWNCWVKSYSASHLGKWSPVSAGVTNHEQLILKHAKTRFASSPGLEFLESSSKVTRPWHSPIKWINLESCLLGWLQCAHFQPSSNDIKLCLGDAAFTKLTLPARPSKATASNHQL